MPPLGLTSQEAELRLRSHGPNLLEVASERTWTRLLFSVLREPMLILLVAAGIINFLLAELADALLLMVTVVIVLSISVIQERRSERAIQSLRDLTAPLANVIRDGFAWLYFVMRSWILAIVGLIAFPVTMAEWVVSAMDSSMASLSGMFIAGLLLALISASSISAVKD